ncbi:MAG TPA: hypothetical protein VIR57_22335 [Chloroflexota bacterium]
MALVEACPVMPRSSTGTPFFVNKPASPMSHTNVELGTWPLMANRTGATVALALADPLAPLGPATVEPQLASTAVKRKQTLSRHVHVISS